MIVNTAPAPQIVDETPLPSWSIWSFYDLTTGLFIDGTFSGPRSAIEENTPEGCEAIEATVDPLSHRVDLQTKEIVDYIPPRPSADHEWNPTTKRWVLKPEVVERIAAREAALREIRRLEQEEQPRPVRETLLGIPGGIDRLVIIQEKIEKLRDSLPTPL